MDDCFGSVNPNYHGKKESNKRSICLMYLNVEGRTYVVLQNCPGAAFFGFFFPEFDFIIYTDTPTTNILISFRIPINHQNSSSGSSVDQLTSNYEVNFTCFPRLNHFLLFLVLVIDTVIT